MKQPEMLPDRWPFPESTDQRATPLLHQVSKKKQAKGIADSRPPKRAPLDLPDAPY
jgi:hypothetical protein